MGRSSGCSNIAYDFQPKVRNGRSNEGKPNLQDCLDNLFEKRGSTREMALSSIIESLRVSCRYQFTEKNFATILYRCLNCFKKGSNKERRLACDVLGLLAITIGCGDKAHELYVESLPILSEALKSRSESVNLISILNCLAIVTFFGQTDSDETQSSMLNIWHYMHSETRNNVGIGNHSAAVQSAAISAWSLLLSSMDGWTVGHKYWQGAIIFFLNLLETDNLSIHAAAGEALALIFEMGHLEKFSGNNTSNNDSSPNDGADFLNGNSSVKELKERVLGRINFLSLKDEAGNVVDGSVKKDCSTWDCITVFKDDGFFETSKKIGKQTVKVNRWCQLLQLNFMNRLLGGGFVTHMLENEHLHDLFDFTPKKTVRGKALYESEREEVKIRFFVPEIKKNLISMEDCAQFKNAPSPALCKARSQILNKNRDIRGEELWASSNDD